MSDSRSFNFQRRRRWGNATLKLALLANDDADGYTVLTEIKTDFGVRELDDESDGGRRQRFEFRLYDSRTVARLNLNSFDLVLFGGRRMEIETKERKQSFGQYVEIIARPTGKLETAC